MDRDAKAKTWRMTTGSACLLFAMLVAGPLVASAADKQGEVAPAKTLSGISIVGNNEAPKSLFIVPWKSSEIASDSGLTSGLMDDSMRPVDREVFMREIDFYEIRSKK